MSAKLDAQGAETPLLSVQSLSLSIGEHVILHDLSFDLQAGQTLGIVGESGSGKSMTALAIMQLLPPGARLQGAIALAGRELVDTDEDTMQSIRGADIGMVFQEPMTALNPVHTIAAQVAESIRLHRGLSQQLAATEARATLDRVGLEGITGERYPHELSGGQRQRVVIAIAIACRPRLLIADEPTTALDVTTQASILALLADLQQATGMAMILISHDLAVVAKTVDQLLVMRDGQILDNGKTDRVFSSAASGYTKRLLEASSWSPSSTRAHESAREELLRVDGLIAGYPTGRHRLFGSRSITKAVDEVSFTVRVGENVGLVGESGSGKSTLARCLLGLMPIEAGRVSLRGKPLPLATRLNGRAQQELGRAVRREIQIVFQDPYGSFNPRHRVERLVAEPLYLLDESLTKVQRRQRVSALLERVGIEPGDALRRFIHEFSGGQRQRIALARALIVQPSLVILDEAVSALDVSVRAQVLALLAELATDEGLAYLFVSHDLSVVRNVTDRVLVMRAGRVVESGATDDVLMRPQSTYTQSLVDAIPVLPAMR